MMKLTKSILLLAILLFAATAAHADQVTFTGVNGVNNGQYYVSPYYGTLNGQPVTLFCVDFGNRVRIGQTWQANLSTLTLGSDLSNTRFGSLPNALTLYQEAAWLISQFSSHPNDWVNLQYALWNLFTSSAPDTAGSNQWLALAAAQAAAGFPGFDFSGFRIITNTQPVTLTGSNQVQEFITIVPEPATLATFGSGLIGLAGLLRRRLRRKK